MSKQKKKDLAELFQLIWDWHKDWEPEGKQSVKVVLKTKDGGTMSLEHNKKFYDAAMAKQKRNVE